jgi:hypothetical protein
MLATINSNSDEDIESIDEDSLVNSQNKQTDLKVNPVDTATKKGFNLAKRANLTKRESMIIVSKPPDQIQDFNYDVKQTNHDGGSYGSHKMNSKLLSSQTSILQVPGLLGLKNDINSQGSGSYNNSMNSFSSAGRNHSPVSMGTISSKSPQENNEGSIKQDNSLYHQLNYNTNTQKA